MPSPACSTATRGCRLSQREPEHLQPASASEPPRPLGASRRYRARTAGTQNCSWLGASFGKTVRVAVVVALHVSPDHEFSKRFVEQIGLIAGVGVAGDAHAGPLVKHRSRVRADPTQPNLRQVHLLEAELFETLAAAGHQVNPGDLGENITTSGVDLHALPVGSILLIGDEALVAITGLRNPCAQIERFQPGLLDHVLLRHADGEVVRRAGIMGVVVRGGLVRLVDRIRVAAPPGPPRALERV